MRLLTLLLFTAACRKDPEEGCSKDCGPDLETDETDLPDEETETDSDTTEETETDDTDPEPEAPLPGFGTITGDCHALDEVEWTSAEAFSFRSTLDLGTTPWDPTLLSAGGQEIMAEGTLGGSSGESEAISFDLLYRCELAGLLKSESEIDYLDEGSKKTDILVEIDGRKVGVSVTRALTYVHPEPCAPVDHDLLATLMERKVGDLQLSKAAADPADAWERSMLYVIACDQAHADATIALFWELDVTTRADAILMVTATEGEDGFIY